MGSKKTEEAAGVGIEVRPNGDGLDIVTEDGLVIGSVEPQAPPPPVPGDANYDWSQHYPKGTELYTHTYPDGKVVALRLFRDIYSKQFLRSIRHLETDFDVESAAIDRGACPAAQELIDSRPCPVDGPDDFHELWKAWTSDSSDDDDAEGVTAGE
ncbi:hypothetical protein ACJEIK_26265 [Mycobacterium sp. SMC-16]|uniref:hypothetical protein n=1 Tax=Mycobacterium sp. SMC-16 TaxID=3385967 RepID=UPI00390C5D24